MLGNPSSSLRGAVKLIELSELDEYGNEGINQQEGVASESIEARPKSVV